MNNNPVDPKFETDKEKLEKQIYILKLFVAGMSLNSIKAIVCVKEIVEEKLPGCYELEVIDIFQHPEFTKQEQIIATPTLIKQYPLPIRKKIGELTSKERIISDLDLFPK